MTARLTHENVFTVRPSTVCNMQCSYCYRADELEEANKTKPFDIDAMVWHAQQKPGSLFNFCGYGETMLHPQFHEMVIALTQVTHVNWVTNGTVFGGRVFEAILSRATHKNIRDVVISIHFEQLTKRIATFAPDLRSAVAALARVGVTTHLTGIVTDENIDTILELKDQIQIPIGYKTTFPVYVQGGKSFTQGYSARTVALLEKHGIRPDQDFRHDPMPFFGRECTNGARVFEVMHDGLIYDCNYDPEKIVIGNINVKEPIRALQVPRLCKAKCNDCIPMVRDGFQLLRYPEPKRSTLRSLAMRLGF